jgi:hypothetical protein
MDRKRLALILPSVVGAGLCLVEALKLAFQFQATDKKDIASGHVEPIRFAVVISQDWDYITTPQMIALCVVLTAVLGLAAVMLTSKWWARDEPPSDPPADGDAEIPPSHSPALPTPRRHPFGRAHH